MAVSDSEKAAWRSLRIRFVIPLVWGFGGVFLIALLLDRPDLKELPQTVALIWFVGLFLANLPITYARCPACKERYYKNRREALAIFWGTNACRNCGAKPPK